jgi:hypothetical protein
MLSQFLNAHSQICVPPELQLIFEYSNNGARLHELFASEEYKEYKAHDFIRKIESMCPHKLKDYYDYKSFFNCQKYPITNLRQLLTDFYAAIAMSRGKTILFEQVPWYGQRLDILNNLFPKARYIHMIRDGRDVSISYARTPWWHDSLTENLERWHYEITKISDDAQFLLSSNQYLEVRYEDFVTNPKEQLHRISKFIGVSFQKAMIVSANHIDYAQYRKFDGTYLSSIEYNKWRINRGNIVFTDNAYGWKTKALNKFECLPAHILDTLLKFGYEV